MQVFPDFRGEEYTDRDGQPRCEFRAEGGLSLRDLLAGLAMMGLMDRGGTADAVAAHAYHVADAMLKAREGKT